MSDLNGISFDNRSDRDRQSSFVSLDINQVLDGSGNATSVDEWTTFQKVQFWILRIVEHIAVQTVSMLLIIIDLILTVIAISIPEERDSDFDHRSRIVSNVFLGYFVVEIIMRFIGIGPRTFCRNLWELIDAVIITICVVVAISVTDPDNNEYSRLSVAGRIFRLVRLVRLAPQLRRCVLSMRLTTSENKRRYRQDGYDLDLTYVTSNVIAMSFPSAGWFKLYRNSIQEVSQFFHDKHKDKFRLYNLCSERDYDDTFFNSNVRRFDIDDHNVPSLEQLLLFVINVEEFLSRDKDNVIAVHCKGGKGRTGTMICAYLMYSDITTYSTGEAARQYFASRRTDRSISTKYQGVQTPSQSRYIDYFEKIITQYSCTLPSPLPSLFINSLTLISAPLAIQSVNSDLYIDIWDRRGVIISFCVASSLSYCSIICEEEKLIIQFNDHIKPCVTGDTKIRFTSKKLPVKYDNVSFYFWFNTLFVVDGVLEIGRDMLDNPHFTKYNNIYHEKFAVRVDFDNKQEQRLI